ncbi:hypothetical protein CLIB1444_05S01178 [[Candida] jaroonii]|uniref:Uncharacterized protein n=1 Tax=[Candida] jaroonii TaxID=467808 RepID=A0ACA9Y7L1_9ASCO|nr:hypothetical protein CLIB1444_05S01178 [[Candida] jaroonii]
MHIGKLLTFGLSYDWNVKLVKEAEITGFYDKRRPVVIWHGLGDNYNSSGMHRTHEIIAQLHPEVSVYSIRLDDDPSKDQQDSLVGDINKQLETICTQIGENKDLSDGFDAIGYSQGGLLLRGLVERCSGAKIHNLITFGSPHMGVMDLPACEDPKDWVCKRRNAFLKKQVWFSSIQHSVVPAQYFRDPYDYVNYMKYSNFLADINNEALDHYNKVYSDRMKMLNKFVMIQFSEDTTVTPKESAHFGELDIQTGEIISMKNSNIYKSDFLGLKTLDSKEALEFFELEGRHMLIPDTFLVNVVNDYLGSQF